MCFYRCDTIVIAHKGVALEGILDYTHFSLVLWISCPVLGRASLSNDDDTNKYGDIYIYLKCPNIPFPRDRRYTNRGMVVLLR